MKKTQKANPNEPPVTAHLLDEKQLKQLTQITEELTRTMEKTRIAEYVQYLEHPARMLWTNFLIGVARGLGATLGLAIVLAIIAYFVQKLIMLNLPGISDFVADLLTMIQNNYNYNVVR